MEGGNGATIGSGITQFAEGEPKRWYYSLDFTQLLIKIQDGFENNS